MRWLWLLLALVAAAEVHAAGPTPVSGEVTANTTWRAADSPYVVTSDLIVQQGVTLTIEPGTVVEFARVDAPKPYTRRAVLRVLGHLRAVGDAEAMILFTGREGAIGDWGGLWIDGGWGGTAELEYVRVEYAQRGVYASGTAPLIARSVFSRNAVGIYLEDADNVAVVENVVALNEYGVYADAASGQITRNVITSNSWGIYLWESRGIVISHNDVKSNTFGIALDGGMDDRITYNEFSIRNRNDYGVLLRRDKPASIDHNNFLWDPRIVDGGTFWYIFNETNAGTVAAPHNWWDTTSTAFIDAYIYDQRDNAARGLVDYQPIAAAPVAGTIDEHRPPVVTALTIPPLSPNGDGRQDTTDISYALSEDVMRVRVEVRRPGESTALWTRTYESSLFRTGQFQRGEDYVSDGVWRLTWDGRDQRGAVVEEGDYVVEVLAEHLRNPGVWGRGAGEVVVDLTPPLVEVLSPARGSKVRDGVVLLTGRVTDRSPFGLMAEVNGRPAPLSAGSAGWFEFSVAVELSPGPNLLEVLAVDAAGNEGWDDWPVHFQPVVTLEVQTPTNQDTQTVRGDVLVPEIDTVVVTVTRPDGTQPSYETDLEPMADGPPYARYRTRQSVALGQGSNVVVAQGRAGGGAAGSSLAGIRYDPWFDQVRTAQFPPGLTMVTVPLTISHDHGIALAIFDDLRLARWQHADGGAGYAYYDGSTGVPLERFMPGRGFWLDLPPDRFPQGHEAPMRGDMADPGVAYVIPLRQGWNQIGNPFLSAVPWSALEVRLPGERAVPISRALQEGWVRNGLWGYAGGGYRLASRMEPWAGYWIRAARDVELIVPPPGASSAGAQAAAARTEARRAGAGAGALHATAGGAGGWTVRLVAAAGRYVDGDNWAGMVRGAAAGYDPRLDVEKAPRVRPYVALEFAPPEGSPPDVAALAVDLRGEEWPADGSPVTWRLTLATDLPDADLMLSWPTVAHVPPAVRLVLIDEESGTVLDLRETSTLRLRSGPEGLRRSLVLAAFGDLPPVAVEGALAYPNPTDLSGPVAIRFTLSRAARLEVRVYDALGRLVRNLPARQGEAGPQEIWWDGRDGRGRVVPNGLYLFHIVARAPGEAPVRATGRVAVLR